MKFSSKFPLILVGELYENYTFSDKTYENYISQSNSRLPKI